MRFSHVAVDIQDIKQGMAMKFETSATPNGRYTILVDLKSDNSAEWPILIHDLRALIDTGATHSIISKALVDGSGIKITGKSIAQEGYTQQSCDSISSSLILHSITGEIHEVEVETMFVHTATEDHEIIIGMDLLNKMGLEKEAGKSIILTV